MPSSKDQDFLEFVLDQLAALKAVVSKRMFGGIGLYRGDTFFAIIDEGRLYFVTDEATRGEYIDLGMKPFQYAPGKFIHTYYEVPVDVLEDDGTLCEWARAAVDAQGRRTRTRVRTQALPKAKSRAHTSKKTKAPARTTARKRK